MSDEFSFDAPLWIYSGKGAWHFVTLPIELAARIRFLRPSAKGFMPVAVHARIGQTKWKTSVFPDSKTGSYLLAVKSEVRKTEKLGVGDEVRVALALA